MVLAHPLSKLGEAQSHRLLCPGLNLANHTCEFCSLSRARTPFMEGLTAVSVTMIICALAPGFRQLSKAAIQHLAFPAAMKHSQDAAGRVCRRGKQGGLHPHFRHGKAGRWKNVHARQLQAQCAAPVCDWEPLPSCTAVDTAPHTQHHIHHRDTAPSIWRHQAGGIMVGGIMAGGIAFLRPSSSWATPTIVWASEE